MEKLDSDRKSFSLYRRPPRLYGTTHRRERGKAEVEVFEPYAENLPFEAGFYTFILDEEGRFRIKRGNFSSHASFSRWQPVGAAGHFRINRAGNVAEVFCFSHDYQIFVPDHRHPTVQFVIDAFWFHHAWEVSLLAIFRFKNNSHSTFFVAIEGVPVEDVSDQLRRLETEGRVEEETADFSEEEIEAFGHYQPTPPIKLYGMHLDQFVAELECSEEDVFEIGPTRPRYGPDMQRMSCGKWAFVIDRDGWLIVGNGHHILSGGNPVGAAGQIIVEPSGVIGEVDLNFSGHYRPGLNGEYARYTFRAIDSHPLLILSPDCRVCGRKFQGLDLNAPRLKFTIEELTNDDPMLDLLIESA